MHEVGFIQTALELADARARAAGGIRVHRLRLRIGTLSGVVPEALRFAFDAMARGTSAAGAELEIDSVPAALWCPTCELEFPAADFLAECPECRQPCQELRRGREIELASVEVS